MRRFSAIAVLFFAMGILFGSPAAHAQYYGAVPPGLEQDPGYQGLTAGNVYVDSKLTNIDQQMLEAAALQGDANPHIFVKIAMLYALPAGVRSRGYYADEMQHYLGLGKNALIVVILGPGRGRGVSIAATDLNKADITALDKQFVPQIEANPSAGTAALAQAVASEIDGKEYSGSGSIVVWIVFFALAIVVIGLIIVANNKKKQRLKLAREPIDALRGSVLTGIEYLDNYADVLPKTNAFTSQVLEMRQAACNHYDQANKVLNNATENSDLARAQILLNQAQGEIDRGRKYLDIVTGGTGNIPGDDAMRPPPLPESAAEALAVPVEQRGVSFFSGRPAAISSLVPVTITVAGQQKTVMATPEEALSLQNGQVPPVRAFNVQGSQVPWYAYNQYDPYRDYWTYQNNGWGGMGTGLVAGFIGAELLDDLFSPRYYGGWNSPYNFSPDYGFNNGYYGGQTDNFGLFGGGGGFDSGFGNQPIDNGQGFDPGANNPVDFGSYGDSSFDPGNDPGNFGSGGFDAGNFDQGGGDFGGGDFGGGDSGGGNSGDF